MFLFLRLFLDILKECEDATEVQFKDDGSWSPIKPDKQPQKNFGHKYSIVELEGLFGFFLNK